MHRRTVRKARFLAGFAALALALAPALAEARPGGGFSSGSRGSRSFNAPPATRTAPGGGTNTFDRSDMSRGGVNQATPARPPSYTPAPAGSRFGGGFMGGMMGGLFGAGLLGMLFGFGFGGISGFAGVIGLLLQIALVVGGIMLLMRFLRRRQTGMAQGGTPRGGMAMAGNAPGYARETQDPMGNRPGPLGGAMRGAASGRPVAPASAAVQVGQADFAAFERNLQAVNAAWSRGDAEALSRLSTPEMLRYFTNDLQDLKARGWRNETRDVRLESGDLAEAWGENGQEFATVAMRFSLIDVTRDSSGAVVEGDPQARQTVTEIWTFTRQPGQDWLLSAIQQAA